MNKITTEIIDLMTSMNNSSSLTGLIEINLDKMINHSSLNSDISKQIKSAMIGLVNITADIKISMSEQAGTSEDLRKYLDDLRNGFL